MSIAFARMSDRINVLYAADLIGPAAGCLAPDPAAQLAWRAGRRDDGRGALDGAAIAFAPAPRRRRFAGDRRLLIGAGGAAQLAAPAPSMSSTRKGTSAIASCSASGIRSRGWPCTTGRMATGR